MIKKSILPALMFCAISFLAKTQTMVVNEIMFKPGPSTSGCDQKLVSQPQPTCGREYIELYNSDCNNDYDLSGYVLASANTAGSSLGNAGAICFPPGTIVPAGSFLIVGGANDYHATANGAFNYPANSFDFKIPNYLGTQYLCLNTANTYWFLGNIDGWMALYEPNGNVHSAVYWSSQPQNITTVADFDLNPCSPTAYSGSALKSAKQIYQTTPALIQYMGNPGSCATGNTFSRLPDGGAFQVNRPPTIGPLRTDRCNDGMCIACGNLLLTSTPDTCNTTDGTITAQVVNQTTSPPPYTYTVTGPVNIGPVNTSTNPYVFNNLPAGTYIVTVVDNFVPPNNTVDTIVVGSTGSLTISGTSSTPASCNTNDGTATVNASGGAAVSYIWSTNPAQNTQTATNLPAGQYTVTVSSGGCSSTASVTVTSLNGPTIAISNTTPASCGMSNGGASTTVNGGTLPLTYQWSSNPAQNNANLQNVPAGSYTVTVTDGQGCSATSTAVITQLNGPNVSISSSTPATCGLSDGTITANAQGGSPPYNYLWSSNPAQNTQTATGLPAGNYTVTLTDGGSCSSTASGTIQMSNNLQLSISVTDAHCGNPDGEATVTVVGGTGQYSYNWNTNPPSNTATISNMPPGNYTVTVDASGCTGTASCVIGNIPGPQAIMHIDPRIVTNYDGDPSVYFSDHSTGNIVNWYWTLGDGNTSDQQQFSYSYSDPGLYYVTLTVTDHFGCVDSIRDSVLIYDLFTIYIPNAFSPTLADGDNDFFYPQGNFRKEDYEFYIYNRWGELFFSTNDRDTHWNGTKFNKGSTKDLVSGIYVYNIILRDWVGNLHQYTGIVILL